MIDVGREGEGEGRKCEGEGGVLDISQEGEGAGRKCEERGTPLNEEGGREGEYRETAEKRFQRCGIHRTTSVLSIYLGPHILI